jgi:hypothetical protein
MPLSAHVTTFDRTTVPDSEEHKTSTTKPAVSTNLRQPRGVITLPIRDQMRYFRAEAVSRTFWVRATSTIASNEPTPTRTDIRVAATLAMQTEHVDLWIDDSLDASQSAELYNQASADLLEYAWRSTLDHFGPLTLTWHDHPAGPCTGSKALVTTDGRLRLLIVAPERMPDAYADIPSYFRSACTHRFHSNDATGLIVVSWSILTIPKGRNLGKALLNSAAHEGQHHANFIRHFLYSDEPFMDEGLSTLAQDLVFNDDWNAIKLGNSANPRRVQAFLRSPEAYDFVLPLTRSAFESEEYSVGGAYGSAYLLQRFLLDTYGNVYLARIRADSSHAGITELEAATEMSISDALVRLSKALWSGIDGTTLFDAVRNESIKQLGSQFLNVRELQPDGSITLLPASISFWRSTHGFPRIISDDASLRITVIPLPTVFPESRENAAAPGDAIIETFR